MHVAPPGGQNWNQSCDRYFWSPVHVQEPIGKWRQLVAKLETNANCENWRPKLESIESLAWIFFSTVGTRSESELAKTFFYISLCPHKELKMCDIPNWHSPLPQSCHFSLESKVPEHWRDFLWDSRLTRGGWSINQLSGSFPGTFRNIFPELFRTFPVKLSGTFIRTWGLRLQCLGDIDIVY